MPMMPPPPDLQDDRSQVNAPALSAPVKKDIAAWSQIDRLEERVSQGESMQRETQQLLSQISQAIAGLRSDVQGLERITAVQLGEIQRRMERAEQQVQRRRDR